MKNSPLKISVLTLAVLICMAVNSRAANNTFRYGLQGMHFVSGLSGIMESSDPWAFQGVVDFRLKAFAFRVLNRFHQEEFWNAYGEATAGIWSADSRRSWGLLDNNNSSHGESDIGLGFGMGVEYDWRGLNSSLPPIGWNIEFGVNFIPAFNLDLGLGAHWKF